MGEKTQKIWISQKQKFEKVQVGQIDTITIKSWRKQEDRKKNWIRKQNQLTSSELRSQRMGGYEIRTKKKISWKLKVSSTKLNLIEVLW